MDWNVSDKSQLYNTEVHFTSFESLCDERNRRVGE